MRSIRTLGLAFIALAALSAVGTSSALALANGEYSVCAKQTGGSYKDGACIGKGAGEWEAFVLQKGGSEPMTAKGIGSQTLTVALGPTIVCATATAKTGAAILGSNKPLPGGGEGTVEYAECKVEGFPGCAINGKKGGTGTIASEVKSELVYLSKAAAEKEEASASGSLFAPKTGELFATVKLTKEAGGSCPAGSEVEGGIQITGSVVAENVEAAGHLETKKVLLPTTSIGSYWINESEEAFKHTAALKAGALSATLSGSVSFTLTSKEAWWIVG